jgi:hypothetical protein
MHVVRSADFGTLATCVHREWLVQSWEEFIVRCCVFVGIFMQFSLKPGHKRICLDDVIDLSLCRLSCLRLGHA